MYPGIDPTIGGLEEVLLYLGFVILLAPTTCILLVAAIVPAMGWVTVNRVGWAMYLTGWALIPLGRLPKVRTHPQTHPPTMYDIRKERRREKLGGCV
jgi:hypothetical protein